MELATGRSLVFRIAVIGLLTVMLFVVLSTATYAWYVITSEVKTGDIVFTSTVIGGNVTIGKSKYSEGESITFDPLAAVSPMIPEKEVVKGETTYAQFLKFNYTYQGIYEIAEPLTVIAGQPTQPATLTVDGQDYFYLNNKNIAYTEELMVEYEIEGELAQKLHIAVFAGDSPNDTKFEFFLSQSPDIHYGEIKAGMEISATPKMDASLRLVSGTKQISLGAGMSKCMRLVVWLDGVDMKKENAEQETKFSIYFKS